MKKGLALIGMVAIPLACAVPVAFPKVGLLLAVLLGSNTLALATLVIGFLILIFGNPGPAGGPGTLAIPIIF
ncbi:MAG: hypothetical protein RMM98_11690 [Acidobacteriota bacterium]|nr:hypothetical protein [Blastocatellia bacterium]MDW8240270.1 hypothetical protein [Acidobacteriota bacterium]